MHQRTVLITRENVVHRSEYLTTVFDQVFATKISGGFECPASTTDLEVFQGVNANESWE